jgi:hypothetical protein
MPVIMPCIIQIIFRYDGAGRKRRTMQVGGKSCRSDDRNFSQPNKSRHRSELDRLSSPVSVLK